MCIKCKGEVSRIFAISRFERAWREKSKPWVAPGDLALIAVIAISLMDPQFSIFIWQNLFMALGFAMVMAVPQIPGFSFWFAVIGLCVMSVISTHFIEKPLARKLRKRYPPVRELAATPGTSGPEVS